MKRFLLKFISFIFCFVVIVYGFKNQVDKFISKNKFYKLNNSVTNIIIGHSHAESAYIDSLLTNTVSLAESGESFFYSYIKLRKLLEANKNIRRVMIEVTNNSLEKEMDEWIYGTMYVRTRFQKYAHLFEKNELKLLVIKNPLAVINSIAITNKYNSNYLRTSDMPYYKYTYWGGFVQRNDSKIDSFLDLRKKLLKEAPETSTTPVINPAKYNLIYLDSIVHMCRQEGKQIIFLRAPQHSAYTNANKESYYFKTLSTRYCSVALIDLGKLQLQNYEFLDFEHVNFKGALKVSKILDSLLHKQYPLSF